MTSTVSNGTEASRTYSGLVAELKAHQKTSKGASAYATYINRPAGRRFAALAFLMRMTPNGVTGVSALCTFAGFAVLVAGPWSVLTGIAAAVLLMLGYALDSADGQLARLQGGGSTAGEWLDHVVDAVKMGSIHLVVLIGWWSSGAFPSGLMLVPIAYQVLATVFFFTIMLTDQLRRLHRGSASMRLAGEGSSSFVYSLAVLPTEYGILALVFVTWGTGLFAPLYCLLLAANVMFLGLALPKWFREVAVFRS